MLRENVITVTENLPSCEAILIHKKYRIYKFGSVQKLKKDNALLQKRHLIKNTYIE